MERNSEGKYWPQRLLAIGIILMAGGVSVYFTLNSIHKEGVYYTGMASFAPLGMPFVFHFLIFDDDPFVLPKPLPLRFWITNGIALLLVIANLYAMQHGLYIWSAV